MNTKNTNKKIKILLPIVVLFVVLVPIFVNAEPIIPCGGYVIDASGKSTPQPPCDFDMLMKLVNNIINWIIMISVPIAAGVFAWAGFKYMTTGIVDQKSEAREMIKKVFIGFVVILSAWIIVNTITNTLLSDKNGFKEAIPVEGTGSSVNNKKP